MCYSISLYSDIRALIRRFGVRAAEGVVFEPSYYVSAFACPEVPVIANHEPDLIHLFRWGLVPRWVRDRNKAKDIRVKTLNARLETLRRRASFKRSYRDRRCLVLVDGFFEFREVGGKKYPYFVHLKSGEPFALAGLWEAWRNPEDGREERTFTVVTVPANPLLSRIHNTKKRMPLILGREMEREWLARPLEMDEVRQVTEGFDGSVLETYPVSRRITVRDVDGSQMEFLDRHDYPELNGD
jgi:putative SOS response-associated peptidase YedK